MARVLQLSRANGELEAAAGQLQEQLEAAQEEQELLEQELQTSETERELLLRHVNLGIAERHSLQQSLQQANALLTAATAAHSVLVDNVAQLNLQLTKASSDREGQQAALAAVEKQVQDLQHQLVEAQAQAAQWQAAA
ncbi:hypothetical protein HaLaN_24673, partial [Haematococcus lacustris]